MGTPGQVFSPPSLRLEQAAEATEAGPLGTPWWGCPQTSPPPASDLRVACSPRTRSPRRGEGEIVGQVPCLWGCLEEVSPVGSSSALASPHTLSGLPGPTPAGIVLPRTAPPVPHKCLQIVTPLSQQPPGDPVQKSGKPQLPAPSWPPDEYALGPHPSSLPCLTMALFRSSFPFWIVLRPPLGLKVLVCKLRLMLCPPPWG